MMEFPVDTSQPVPGQHSAPAFQEQGPRHPTVAALQSTTESKWTTLLTFFVGDAVGLLFLFAAMQVVAPWIAPATLGHVSPVFVGLVPILIASFWFAGFYRLRFVHPALEMKEMAMVTAMMGGTATLTLSFALGSAPLPLLVGVDTLIATVTLPACRAFTRVLCARLSWVGTPNRRHQRSGRRKQRFGHAQQVA